MPRAIPRLLACTLFASLVFGGGCNGGGESSGDQQAAKDAAHQSGNNPASVVANLPAAAQPACAILVPDAPLTAQGLATPYQLMKPCQEANVMTNSAFVQAVILDPATGALTVYNPLVIDEGTQPLVCPAAPQLPNNAVVGIWFGFNGTTLVPVANNANTLANANCVSGLGNSFFGQVAACNAVNFFSAAEAAIAGGNITPPPLGTAKDGQPCPTTRDFSVVDQDPSDNVTTSYLVSADGRVAQNTPENVASLKASNTNVTVINNGSDNALLAAHIDPALGCTPWEVTDVTSPGGKLNSSAQALNELHAQTFHNPNNVDPNTIALVEQGDEMVLVNGDQNQTKLNLYRANVDEPADIMASDSNFCKQLAAVGAPRINADQNFTQGAPTVDPAQGNNLFTFLVARLQTTMGNVGNGLNCGNFGVKFPFDVTKDGNGVVTGAKFNP